MGENDGMRLPVMPPVEPMLAKPVKEIPRGELSYEPKWDGFRSIIFRDGDEVEIGSRNERPMTRYFPEVVEAVKANLPRALRDRRRDHPGRRRPATGSTSRRCSSGSTRPRAGSTLLAEQTPARFVAFDLLALGDEDLTGAAVRASGAQPLERGARRRRSRRSTSRRRRPTWPPPRRGSSSSRAPAWTG